MLGFFSIYSKEYLATLMIVTTLFFALPIFVAPLQWAKLMGWAIPQERHLAVYFGRCLGAFILVVEIIMLHSVMNGIRDSYAFDVLYLVFLLMAVVHIYGAIRKVQPLSETLEIGLWLALIVLNTLFYPGTAITF